MKVTLLLNIGTKDADRLGLDRHIALDGNTIEVKKAAADELLARGWAKVPEVAGPEAAKK